MYEKELEAMIEVALHAQKVIMEIYNTNFEVEIKSDDSPLTRYTTSPSGRSNLSSGYCRASAFS
jgi:hypothetical protein